jgi:hypothetical protein
MLVLLFVVNNGIYDVVSFNLRSCDEAGRQFNREIRTDMIFIFPSCNVANNLLDVIVAKLSPIFLLLFYRCIYLFLPLFYRCIYLSTMFTNIVSLVELE